MRDLIDEGGQYVLKFHEKGGKQRTIPVRFDLQQLLLDYLAVADPLRTQKDAPLFRSLESNGTLSARPLNGVNICRMMKRRLAADQDGLDFLDCSDHKNVAGVNVPMQNLESMEMFVGTANGLEQLQDFSNRKGIPFAEVGYRESALDISHHEIRRTVWGPSSCIHRNDVGVLKP